MHESTQGDSTLEEYLLISLGSPKQSNLRAEINTILFIIMQCSRSQICFIIVISLNFVPSKREPLSVCSTHQTYQQYLVCKLVVGLPLGQNHNISIVLAQSAKKPHNFISTIKEHSG
jgi:hypothetical protein